MSDNKPQPCPFCGETGLDFSAGSTFRWLAYSCGSCGIGSETRVQTMGEGTPEEWRESAEQDAIDWWNTRAAPPAPPAIELPELPEPWRATVDDMLTVCHMTASDDPRESVNRLINWHVSVALDPCVSSDAQALIDQGAALAADRAARPVLTDEQIKALFDETKWPSEQFTIRVLSFARAVLAAATQGSKL